MLEIFGAIAGFAGSLMPSLMKYFQDNSDKKHELNILKLQIEQNKERLHNKLEEVLVCSDIEEGKAIYKTFYSGIAWVDAFNAMVRPVLAYAFFILYAYTKIVYFCEVEGTIVLDDVWNSVDNTIFLTIISFFYGQRAMQKIMK